MTLLYHFFSKVKVLSAVLLKIAIDRYQAAKVEFEMFRTFSNEFRDNLNKNLETTLKIANSTLPFYDMSTKEFLVERIKEGARIIEAL